MIKKKVKENQLQKIKQGSDCALFSNIMLEYRRDDDDKDDSNGNISRLWLTHLLHWQDLPETILQSRRTG